MAAFGTYDAVLVYIGVTQYAFSLVQGATAFGDGILFHLSWIVAAWVAPEWLHSTPLGDRDLEIPTLLISVRAGVVMPIFAYMTYDDWCWPLIKIGAPILVVTSLAGAVVLHEFGDAPTVHTGLGIVFGACALYYGQRTLKLLVAEKQAERRRAKARLEGVAIDGDGGGTDLPPASPTSSEPFVVTSTHKAVFAVASFIGGFLGGLTSVTGPPIMIASLIVGLPSQVFRGTFPPLVAALFFVRMVITFATGNYNLGNRAWMAYVVMTAAGVTGLHMGLFLARKISDLDFALAVSCLLFLAAVGLASPPPLFALAALLLAGAVVGGAVLYRKGA